jgi:hypothetical protein
MCVVFVSCRVVLSCRVVSWCVVFSCLVVPCIVQAFLFHCIMVTESSFFLMPGDRKSHILSCPVAFYCVVSCLSCYAVMWWCVCVVFVSCCVVVSCRVVSCRVVLCCVVFSCLVVPCLVRAFLFNCMMVTESSSIQR